MPIVCPTVTAFDTHEYRTQIERIQGFAQRIHIDLMDGQLAPTKSPPLSQIWLPDEIISDIHLMYQNPENYFDQLIRLRPHLVIIHAEADVNHREFANKLHDNGIRAGLAVLQDTRVESTESFDHVLIFSGNLGHHGGEADLSLLSKVSDIQALNPEIEISWDGGINAENAQILTSAGVQVLNVGGFIQKAENPEENYRVLANLA